MILVFRLHSWFCRIEKSSLLPSYSPHTPVLTVSAVVLSCLGLPSTAQNFVIDLGKGWDSMAVTLFPQCNRKLLNI